MNALRSSLPLPLVAATKTGIIAATKTRILDAAEKLFGLKGFDATSLRDITAEAQVNLADQTITIPAAIAPLGERKLTGLPFTRISPLSR